jgi:hypothetical protein
MKRMLRKSAILPIGIFAAMMSIAVAQQQCDYPMPHYQQSNGTWTACNKLTQAEMGWQTGTCSYLWCDSSATGCTPNGPWTEKKRVRQVWDQGAIVTPRWATKGAPVDIVQGCCHCITSYSSDPPN